MVDFLKLLVVFALIVLLLRRRFNLGLVMLVGAVSLGTIFQLSPLRMLEVAAYTVTQFSTINLILALVFIMFLENIMRKTQMTRRMVDSLIALLGDRRLVMALLPAFIGFLPSAGGAVFSAPMVEEVTRDLPMTPETKSFVNYWYRHIWEYVFPLYPSLILAAQIAHVSLASLIVVQFPLTLTAMVVGAPLAFKGLGHLPSKPADLSKDNIVGVAAGISPVLALLILVLAVKLDISIALAIVVVALLAYNRYSLARVVELVREAFSFTVVLLVLGVLLFKDMLAATGAVNSLPVFFASLGVPSVLVIIALPLAVGLLTGIAQAPIGIAFPIVIGLSGGAVDLRLIALAFASSFAGTMLSPAHLCLVLTIEHFKASIGRVLSMSALPQAAVLLVAVGFYALR